MYQTALSVEPQLSPSRARAESRLLSLDDSLAAKHGGAKLSPLLADSSLCNSGKDVPDAFYSGPAYVFALRAPAPSQLVGFSSNSVDFSLY
jgi:hypothetical protein